MNNIHYIICVTDKNKSYINKLKDFRLFGLKNIKELSVSVDLLTGPDETFFDSDITENWDSEISVKEIKTPYLNPSSKLGWYYLNEFKNLKSEWIVKIHEDSINDVFGIYKNLQDLFSPEKPNYVISEPSPYLEVYEKNILKNLNYNWDITYHEKEMFCLNQKAIDKINESSEVKKYLEERLKYEEQMQDINNIEESSLNKNRMKSKSDDIMGIIGRMTKIHPAHGYVFTHESRVCNFSLFGGPYCHVHLNSNVEKIYYKYKSDIIKSILTKEQEEISFKFESPQERIKEDLKLNKNGIITNSKKQKFGIGCIDENNLWIITSYAENIVLKADLKIEINKLKNKYEKGLFIILPKKQII